MSPLASWLRSHSDFFIHCIRTTVAAVLSLAVASKLALPEAYWASITLIVMQSSLGAALSISEQRFAGTALGAFLGALAGYFSPTIFVYGVAVFLAGIICVLLRLSRSAYRFASITLAVASSPLYGPNARLLAPRRDSAARQLLCFLSTLNCLPLRNFCRHIHSHPSTSPGPESSAGAPAAKAGLTFHA
jgi:uncharacterized membrane protein YccC